MENALLHGIQNKPDGQGEIKISAEKQDDCIVITVSDNGQGMTEEKIREILDHGSGGYGLHSVNERLRLFSGFSDSKYGVRIHSEPETGTTVILTLKAKK